MYKDIVILMATRADGDNFPSITSYEGIQIRVMTDKANTMTLSETIKFLKQRYPQSDIDIEGFDPQTKTRRRILQPRFLFRGESSFFCKTETTYRRLIAEQKFDSLQWCEIRQVNYELYIFLRSAIYNLSRIDNSPDNPFVEHYIAGILQHYGFDTSFIDLTADLSVAGHFASGSDIGSRGRLFVISMPSIIENCFDLTKCPGNRPKIQKAFALWDNCYIDLKNKQYLKDHSAAWFEFTLAEEDKAFNNPHYISLHDDEVARHIIDWFDNSDINLTLNNPGVRKYFEDIVVTLRM